MERCKSIKMALKIRQLRKSGNAQLVDSRSQISNFFIEDFMKLVTFYNDNSNIINAL